MLVEVVEAYTHLAPQAAGAQVVVAQLQVQVVLLIMVRLTKVVVEEHLHRLLVVHLGLMGVAG